VNNNKENIPLKERNPQPYVLKQNFSNDELLIIQDITSKRGKFIEVIPTLDNRHSVKPNQYVGVVTLPEHTIIIQPKIPEINIYNMIRYAYDTPDILPEQIFLGKGNNFYDILIKMLLLEVDDIIRRIPNRGFVSREGNLTYITGKILFNQQILRNPGAAMTESIVDIQN
jgi:5-methylcytosine-specific restriction endonuclease McrBC regulatory subunit McrC